MLMQPSVDADRIESTIDACVYAVDDSRAIEGPQWLCDIAVGVGSC